MKLTSRSEYALLALIYMARSTDESYLSVDQIAIAQGIPPKFLEQILLTLKKARFLQSIQGQRGGYRLARPAAQIRMCDILCLFESNLRSSPHRGEILTEVNIKQTEEKLQRIMGEITSYVEQKLEETSIADLC